MTGAAKVDVLEWHRHMNGQRMPLPVMLIGVEMLATLEVPIIGSPATVLPI